MKHRSRSTRRKSEFDFGLRTSYFVLRTSYTAPHTATAGEMGMFYLFADRGKGDKHLEDGSYRYLFCTYVSRVTCHMATRLNGRDGFGTFQRGRIHVSIDIFNLNSFLFRRWETIIVFPPSRGLLLGFNIYAVYVFPYMNMHNLAS